MTETDGAIFPFGEFQTAKPEDTFELGRQIGAQLIEGAVLLLSGQLGAGKTVFAKGVAEGLGIDGGDVTSPSFTLVNRHTGRLVLYHIDLYRLQEGIESAFAVDLDDVLSERGAVVMIEWAERLGRYPLPANALRIHLVGDGDDSRQISISRSNERVA